VAAAEEHYGPRFGISILLEPMSSLRQQSDLLVFEIA
jgi:hypothetical protein